MRHKIKGIVLREAPKGETSKLLTVLASDLGVITVNAKGVRKLSSPYIKSAQQFAFSDMLLYEKKRLLHAYRSIAYSRFLSHPRGYQGLVARLLSLRGCICICRPR